MISIISIYYFITIIITIIIVFIIITFGLLLS